MGQFSERYKTFSNQELLKLLDNQSGYEPEPISDAKTELKNRNLSESELIEGKKELEIWQQEKFQENEKRLQFEHKIENLKSSIVKSLNPIQTEAPSTKRFILLISIVFGIIAGIRWFNEFEFIWYLFTDSYAEWGISELITFLPLMIITVSVILFWFRKRWGWILLAAYLTYTAVSALGLIMVSWNMKPVENSFFESFVTLPPTSGFIMLFLFYGGALWAINRKKIKIQFNINPTTALTIMVISLGLTLFYIAPYMVF